MWLESVNMVPIKKYHIYIYKNRMNKEVNIMSMPEVPQTNLDLTRDQALNMILSSIAMEEIALSHIINAESEKIQYVLSNHSQSCCCNDDGYILEVNKSVANLLELVMQNQMLLKNKMEKVLEYIPKPSPNKPHLGCKPENCCCMQCSQQQSENCLEVVPSIYNSEDALRWMEQGKGICENFCNDNLNSSTQILLPRCNCVSIGFSLEFLKLCEEAAVFELQISCLNNIIYSKYFYDTGENRHVNISETVVIKNLLRYPFCTASIFLCAPQRVQIGSGKISFHCA